MKINPLKLEVKYALELFQEIPGYPTEQDIMYLIIKSLEEKDLLEQSFTPDNLWDGLKNCLGTITEIRNYLEAISNNKNSYIQKLTSDKRGGTYKLLSNPWM